MKKKFELILSYLANEVKLDDTDLFEIILIGTPDEDGVEIQTCYNPGQNLPTNYVFESDNILKVAIKNVIDMYYNDEEKHFLESEDKQNHIFNDLMLLKELIE